ncbi:MAG: hypothetical protein O3A46_12485 [Candidatus Poribacteria bacterium]|nr:hypothetical protein [Candidatus Poribacteria bacterium]
MAATVLEVTRDLVLAYIEKYPTGTSAYSANVEATMAKMRADIVSFMKQIYDEIQTLEEGALPPLDEDDASGGAGG